jgi:UDP-N-acetyl-D-glucosamine/UDP-N-acetyl-D-galactosamine dehydrogenase
MTKKPKIAIIGLGYVGLPLAVAFAKKYEVNGFDINSKRIEELKQGIDGTLEVTKIELRKVLEEKRSTGIGLRVSSNIESIKDSQVYIVTVPTPIDKNNKPILTPMESASNAISKVLKIGDVVIYESTVFPGATEDIMVPVLEKSGLRFNRDFYCGYSPERINPGDKIHTVTKIIKVTSGSTPEVAEYVDQLYKSIIHAGTFKASSIKVAEAAKVIENSQRDINIAFVNELSKIFNLLDIDTQEVLEAAGTKWNFLPFKPGLVGGHCIGVDPYYLAQKALEVGYHPEIILAGRRLNASMGNYVAGELIKSMIQKDIQVKGSKILMLGFTFKENCPDVRNTRVIDVYTELESYGANIDLHDPWANPSQVWEEYGIKLKFKTDTDYDAVILLVAHHQFHSLKLKKLVKHSHIIYDVKGMLPKEQVDFRL